MADKSNRLRAFGNWLQAWRERLGALSDLRITLGVIALGAVIVVGLDPGRDVIRGMVDTANTRGNGAAGIPGDVRLQWFLFWFACLWTGVNAWYWSHLLYKARCGHGEPGWFRGFRRFLGIVPLVCAVIAMFMVAERGVADIWRAAALFSATAFALLVFFWWRGRLAERHPDAWYNQPVPFFATPEGEKTTAILRGDVAFIAASILLSILLLILFMIPGIRTEVAWTLGPAAIAFASIGCIIPLTSGVIWWGRRFELPVVTIGLAMVLLFSLWNDNHQIRVIDDQPNLAHRPQILDALKRWEELHPDQSDPIVLIATAGGASRAAYWTGTVLRALEDNDPSRDFPRDVFAISSVSGGSLGAVGYAAWIADHQYEEGRLPAPARQDRAEFVRTFFGTDYLAPAVGGLLFPDFIQRFLPGPWMPSRATSLEESWEKAWERSNAACAALSAAGPGHVCPTRNRMREDFLRIWEGVFDPGADARSRRWVPIALVNGTHVESGKRMITAPVKISSDVFEDSYDFYDSVQGPIRASTAVLNSARFPIVSPAGTLLNHGHIVDGGYFENGGMETLLDLARYIREKVPHRPIIIVEINNDDQAAAGDWARHPPGGEPDQGVAVRPVGDHDRSPFIGEIGSIVGGLYRTRDARGVLAAKRASRAQGRADADTESVDAGTRPAQSAASIDFIQFKLGKFASKQHTAMSWALSLGSRDRMDVVFNMKAEEVPDWLKGRGYSERRRAQAIADLQAVILCRPPPGETQVLSCPARENRAQMVVLQRLLPRRVGTGPPGTAPAAE
ncbi:MAG TPA: hypothetical protein VFZ91_10080 [Allosphingosinicella sp.]